LILDENDSKAYKTPQKEVLFTNQLGSASLLCKLGVAGSIPVVSSGNEPIFPDFQKLGPIG